jgi:uncharacterized membrane protein
MILPARVGPIGFSVPKHRLALRVHDIPCNRKELEMSELNAVVAVYATHTGAEEAVKELQHAGIDMRTLSIVSKGPHTDEQVVGYYNTGERMKYWGKTGAFWGGFWGLLFGSAFFAVPVIGPVLVAGPLVAWIVGALEGAVVIGGLSAVGAGLYSMGIPKDSVIEYESAIKTDKYIVMVQGKAAGIRRSREALENTKHVKVNVHWVEVAGAAGR